MKRNKLISTVAIATTCALVGAAGGIASSSAATKAKPSKPKVAGAPANYRGPDGPGRGGGRPPGPPAVHATDVELNAAGTAFVTVTRDMGTVTAVDGSSLTIHEGSKTVSYADPTISVASGAKVVRDGATATLADVKVGDHVMISQSTDGSTVFAADASWKPTHPDGLRGFADHDGPPPPPPVAG